MTEQAGIRIYPKLISEQDLISAHDLFFFRKEGLITIHKNLQPGK